MTQILKSLKPWKLLTAPVRPQGTPSAEFPWTVPKPSGLLAKASKVGYGHKNASTNWNGNTNRFQSGNRGDKESVELIDD